MDTLFKQRLLLENLFETYDEKPEFLIMALADNEERFAEMRNSGAYQWLMKTGVSESTARAILSVFKMSDNIKYVGQFIRYAGLSNSGPHNNTAKTVIFTAVEEIWNSSYCAIADERQDMGKNCKFFIARLFLSHLFNQMWIDKYGAPNDQVVLALPSPVPFIYK